jgi:serine/threonine protein kinase
MAIAPSICDGLELGETLSTSRYSTVYRATRTLNGERLVLKAFTPDDKTRAHHINAEQLARDSYANEKHIATILHVAQACRGIFPIYVGAGQFDARTPALLMEYIPFPTLATYMMIRGDSARERALPHSVAVTVIFQLLGALGFLLHHGIAHRDIKADNIMVDQATHSIRLIDFGLALQLTAMDKTVSNKYVGTPLYCAPEILRADGYYNVILAEIWSCGILLREMLDGRQPYSLARSQEDLQEMQHDYLPSPRHPAPIACLLQKMLVYDAYHRSRLDKVTDAAACVMSMFNPDWVRPDD